MIRRKIKKKSKKRKSIGWKNRPRFCLKKLMMSKYKMQSNPVEKTPLPGLSKLTKSDYIHLRIFCNLTLYFIFFNFNQSKITVKAISFIKRKILKILMK